MTKAIKLLTALPQAQRERLMELAHEVSFPEDSRIFEAGGNTKKSICSLVIISSGVHRRPPLQPAPKIVWRTPLPLCERSTCFGDLVRTNVAIYEVGAGLKHLRLVIERAQGPSNAL